MKIFDYIYYRTYQAYRRKDSNPEIYAEGLVSLLLGLTIIDVFILISLTPFFRTLLDFPEIIMKSSALFIIVVGFIIFKKRYGEIKPYEELEKDYKDEYRTSRVINGIAIVIYVILSLAVPMGLGVLRHNFGIDI